MLARLGLGMHRFRVSFMGYECGREGDGEAGLRLSCRGQLGFLVSRAEDDLRGRIRRAVARAWGWGTNTDRHPGSEGWVVKRVRALNHGTGFC